MYILIAFDKLKDNFSHKIHVCNLEIRDLLLNNLSVEDFNINHLS